MSRLLLKLGIAAFVAAMLAGPGAAVFPSTFRWAAWAACPEGTAAAPERFRASYSRPGESQVRFLCVHPDGRAEDRTGAALGGLFLMYFVGISVLLSLLSLRGAARAPAAAAPTTPRAISPGLEAAARKLMAAEQKIHAIRLVREQTGMGLKEAKDWVEALEHRPPSPATEPGDASRPAPSLAPSERLAELRRMAEAGLISPDEYEAKKAEILAEL